MLVAAALFLSAVSSSWAKPVVVFDLDHTLFHTNFRIQKIFRELGEKHQIPELKNITLDQVIDFRMRREQSAIAPAMVDLHDEFRKIFYFDSTYLKYDVAMLGAQSLVTQMVRDLGFDIVYLTGRSREGFTEATRKQLADAHFPGFGNGVEFADRVRLFLKPEQFADGTAQYKVEELERIEKDGDQIVAIFDDSSRNLVAFHKKYGDSTVLVRVGVYASHELDAEVAQRVITLKNYIMGEDRDHLLERIGTACENLLR